MVPDEAKTFIFVGLGGVMKCFRLKIDLNNLLCSCRQPPADICDLSRHPESANPEFFDFSYTF